MQVILANPRGFCAGVDRAIEIVERALQLFGAPIYVRHEVVHNKFVVDGLRNKGAVFVDELDHLQRPWRVEGSPSRSQTPWPQSVRRHLSVSHQSASGSNAVFTRRAGVYSYRA